MIYGPREPVLGEWLQRNVRDGVWGWVFHIAFWSPQIRVISEVVELDSPAKVLDAAGFHYREWHVSAVAVDGPGRRPRRCFDDELDLVRAAFRMVTAEESEPKPGGVGRNLWLRCGVVDDLSHLSPGVWITGPERWNR